MHIGIISQCMVKPRQINDQYLGNLALKINLKVGVPVPNVSWMNVWGNTCMVRLVHKCVHECNLTGVAGGAHQMGGFNSPLSSRMTTCLGEEGRSTIIFGMDVSHGSPGDANVPSIAAVVATKNWPEVFHYSSQVRTQPAKMEMIEGLYEPGMKGMVTYVSHPLPFLCLLFSCAIHDFSHTCLLLENA